MAEGIEGMAALRATLSGMKARIEDPEPGLLRMGVIALDRFKANIELGGPGWAPNKTGTPLLRKTGRLFNSFTANALDDILRVGANEVEAGTNVPYAVPLNFGTSGRPSKAHEAKLAAMLGGAGFFRHSGALVGGMPARELVYIDAKLAESLKAAFADYIMGKK